MSVRADIRSFLANPGEFARGVASPEADLWRAGLAFAQSQLKPPGRELRQAQIDAWEGSTDRRAALVLGPPGTGKTFLLAWMTAGFLHARRTAGRPCRVLLTGFTRESIGNLFRDLVPVLTVHLPEVLPIYFGQPPEQPLPMGVEIAAAGWDDLDNSRSRLAESYLVAGATGWTVFKLLDGGKGTDGDGPTAKVFDLVVIDEASQLMLAQGLLSLAGLADGGRVLVAGDDRQLPPVRSTIDAASADGRVLGGSLYDFLKTGGVSEFPLTETFRLSRPLAQPPSRLFYDNQYDSAVAARRLTLRSNWATGLADWEKNALDPEHPVCVLIHDGPPCGTDNPFERSVLRRLTVLLAERMLSGSASELDARTLWGDRLAVVTPHRAQNAALRTELADLPLCGEALVSTVDRIQGQERDAVLVGYTVSDPEFALAEANFLFSAERLNVTVTRARSKLVLLVSRRLFEVIPTDEDVFDAAGTLREYVFDTDHAGSFMFPAPDGANYPIELRLRRFPEDLPPPPPTPETASVPLTPLTPPQTPQPVPAKLAPVLEAIRQAITRTTWGAVADSQIAQDLGRKPVFEELRSLVSLGHLVALPRVNKSTGQTFLVWSPREEPQPTYPCDLATARRVIASVTEVVRGGYPRALYENVRGRFVWFDPQGNDLFREIAKGLVAEDICRFDVFRMQDNRELEQFDVVEQFEAGPLPSLPVVAEDPTALSDADFEVLNALEDVEQARINFGGYETAVPPSLLAGRLSRAESAIRASLNKLALHHYLLHIDQGMVRSRMAEMARLVRYVKQRFRVGDAEERPFMIRALQLKTLNRDKPARDQELRQILTRLTSATRTVKHADAVLGELEPLLREFWGVPSGKEVCIAGFQQRGLEQLLRAYLGLDTANAFVITADTGSGKTEAAALPLIAGAAIDRLAGREGVKAVFVYPRVRLAYNQAQRLVGYLAMLASRPGMPTLTLGVQAKDVPKTLNPAYIRRAGELARLWLPTEDRRGFQFPLFPCPNSDCNAPLRLDPGKGIRGADSLTCNRCGWGYRGWVGTKEGIQKRPPDFFLPVTESLHQWLHDPDAWRVFGDEPSVPGPRAVVADEIHLYSHIHGAQVGFTLRRLLARCELNARQTSGDPCRPLAVGMSATLGQPTQVWSALTGRDVSAVTEITPLTSERRPNPRGREYYYFVQPEVESRGVPVAGESATIQTLMVLAHGMRRRPGDRGGYRGIVFFDSIDSLKRLLDDYRDAENGGLAGHPLAALRTRRFPPHPTTGHPRRICCQAPANCDIFDRGECWYFAAEAGDPAGPGANDRCQVAASSNGSPVRYLPGQPLRVMPTPVYSGTSGRVDRMMRDNDLVFATSSLEVGFDDPDMILVYQHYAPVNLASFIQRKGRGGRGADDRPVTGITLSVYSPRDSWFFRHPDRMLHAAGFEVPLNPDNFFVRRGQAVAAILDVLARHSKRIGADFPPACVASLWQMTEWLSAAGDDAKQLLDLAFGTGWETGLGVAHAQDLWKRANLERPNDVTVATDHVLPPKRLWRKFMPWVPQKLYDAINLPQLLVKYRRDDGTEAEEAEDVSLAFGQCAPGHATRRYGDRLAQWLVPPNPAPYSRMLNQGSYAHARTEPLLSKKQVQDAGNTDVGVDARIREGLPCDMLARLADGHLPLEMIRPTEIQLSQLGRFDNGDWRANWYWDPSARELREGDPDNPPEGCLAVHHRSGGRLLGFPLLRANQSLAETRRTGDLVRLTDTVQFYTGGPKSEETGLSVARAFWGAEVVLRLDDEEGTEESWSYTFTDRLGTRPQLHGYTIETEGVQLTPIGTELDGFLDREVKAIEQDEPRSRWLHGQFFRYLLITRIQAAGLTSYAAGPVADLLVAANGSPAFRTRFRDLVEAFDPTKFSSLLSETLASVLSCHPMLTPTRLTEYLVAVATPVFGAFLKSAVAEVRDPAKFRDYLRSLVLHGLLMELHGLFVIHGRGDERQVLGHARLPVQFPGVRDDTLSVFESGDHGDGTTRTFRTHLGDALGEWLRGDLGNCPYAAEDALLDLLFESDTRHAGWRARNPRDPSTIPRIARELTGTNAVDPVHQQAIWRVLFQEESAGTRHFAVYDLHGEIRSVRHELEASFRRRPSAWELVSESVRRAEAGEPTTPTLTKLYHAYQNLAVGGPRELGAQARLAEQVYRLGASMCVDGCRGCLHRPSPLMADAQAAVLVSRDLLSRYREFVLETVTTVVSKSDAPATVTRVLNEKGYSRLLVDPSENDVHAAALSSGGFTGGIFDPLLRRVVWLRGA